MGGKERERESHKLKVMGPISLYYETIFEVDLFLRSRIQFGWKLAGREVEFC